MSVETGRQFVDTNVLVYAHDVSAGSKQQKARLLIENLWLSRNGCLSIQVLQEFYVTVTQKLSHPLSKPVAFQLISDLGAWQIHRPSVADILGAIQLQERHQVSFWDAMILRSASGLRCNVLWSEDLNPGQLYRQVRVVSPFI